MSILREPVPKAMLWGTFLRCSGCFGLKLKQHSVGKRHVSNVTTAISSLAPFPLLIPSHCFVPFLLPVTWSGHGAATLGSH